MSKYFDVNNFEYNGFYGNVLDGKAPYKAQFINWTNDPGVALMKCTDGKERLIPSFAVDGLTDEVGRWVCPEGQKKVMFGPSLHS